MYYETEHSLFTDPLAWRIIRIVFRLLHAIENGREEPADNRDYNSSQMSGDTAYMANRGPDKDIVRNTMMDVAIHL